MKFIIHQNNNKKARDTLRKVMNTQKNEKKNMCSYFNDLFNSKRNHQFNRVY